MSKVVIADSSCLIGLSKIGELDLLRQLFGQVLVPKAVYHEVVVRGANRPGASELAAASWIEVCEIKDQLALRTLKLTLGVGESEAIILASEKSADYLILDDWKARQIALGLEFPVVSTTAILSKTSEKGLLAGLPMAKKNLRLDGCRFLLKMNLNVCCVYQVTLQTNNLLRYTFGAIHIGDAIVHFDPIALSILLYKITGNLN